MTAMSPANSFRRYLLKVVKPQYNCMKTIAGFAFLLLLVVFGCDPVRRINMKNETGDTVRFIWTLKEDSALFNPWMLYNSRELAFTILPSKAKKVKLSFGEGRWSPTDVQKITSYLESLEIISATQRIKIDSLPLLNEFLLARRKGIGGARIEIAASQ